MSGFPEKILLARDLASDALESTTPAAQAAGDLAKKGGAELHVVYVWRTVPSPHFGQVKRSGLEVAGRGALEEQVWWIEGAGGTVCGAHRREGLAAEADGDGEIGQAVAWGNGVYHRSNAREIRRRSHAPLY